MSDRENNGSVALAKNIGTIGQSQKRRSVLRANVGGVLPGTLLVDLVDYYEFQVDQKGLLDIVISGSERRNINYQLLDSNGNVVLSNLSGSITINQPVSKGTYYLKLSPDIFTQQGTSYGFGLEFQRADCRDCDDDDDDDDDTSIEPDHGYSLAGGNFDGNGSSDLAIGVPGFAEDSGTINVLYGKSSGLSIQNQQIWNQKPQNIRGEFEKFDRFGSALIVGDFNGDKKDDLAIGAHLENINEILRRNEGAVNVLYGSQTGLSSKNNQMWLQSSRGIKGKAEIDDFFGYSLGAGDFNGDGRDDLAIGVIGEDIENVSAEDAGAVNVIYGSRTGLSSENNQIWHQNSLGIKGNAEAGDEFGNSLGVGDFNGDGRDDLAIGVIGENIENVSAANAGAVNVIYGSRAGLSSKNNQIWHQDSLGIKGNAEAYDEFGNSLGVGDFNGDGYDDLAIGVPGEGIENASAWNAGAVNVIYGSSDGLTAKNNQIWHQDSLNVAGAPETNDNFGYSLGVSDFNNDGFVDLAIGVLGEKIDGHRGNGAVNVLYGSSSGLTGSNSDFYYWNSP